MSLLFEEQEGSKVKRTIWYAPPKFAACVGSTNPDLTSDTSDTTTIGIMDRCP